MSDLGEKAFLRSLLPSLKVDPSFVNGFGHDASILDIGLEQLLACKIDRAPFPVAIGRGVGCYRVWGRLAVAANVSDLLAVGAEPRAMMLSLVVPGNFEADAAREIVMGCEESCISHRIAFVGGDTKEGTSPQVVGAAWGTVIRGAGFGREAAKPGDFLFIAGRLGAFASSLALMDSQDGVSGYPKSWIDALVSPMARINEGRYMRESCKVVAACDLSDGLADAIRIFCADGAGITLSEPNLPMNPLAKTASEKLRVPLWRFAFGVGDWAIAFVVRESDVETFRAGIPDGMELTQAGRFDGSGDILVKDRAGRIQKPPELINEHFRRRAEDDDNHYLRALTRKR
ncbi:thiamine-phosphate kinase [Halopseudomonas salina]|nr:AIR synthase related protein [Halopseudomonas salina]